MTDRQVYYLAFIVAILVGLVLVAGIADLERRRALAEIAAASAEVPKLRTAEAEAALAVTVATLERRMKELITCEQDRDHLRVDVALYGRGLR